MGLKAVPWLTSVTLLACAAGREVFGTATKNCPPSCKCMENNTVVDCSYGRLRFIPHDIPSTVKTLDLSSNSITSVSQADFEKLSNLIVLMMRNNDIQIIEDSAFRKLEKLQVLDLSRNGIQLSDTIFRNLTSLKELHLYGNGFRLTPNVTYPSSLTELSIGSDSPELPSSFQQLTSLRIFHFYASALKINHTDLKWLPANVETLIIDGAATIKIGDGVFCRYTRLQEFTWTTIETDLSGLQETLESLNGCRSLTVLNLFIHSNLSVLPANTFSGLKGLRLQNLSLLFSQISIILAGAFPEMPHLRHLTLNTPELDEIQDSLSGMTHLQTLWMSVDRKRKLPIFYLPSLEELTLFGFDAEVCTGGIFLSTNLTYLDLSRDGLNKLEGDCFMGLHDLKTLDLTENQITFDDPDMFRNVSNLTNLNLCATGLTSTCYILPLVRLRTLDLSYNSITEIDTDMEQTYCLSRFTYLEKLDMGHNMLGPLFAVPGEYDQPFAGLMNLETLILSANYITSIQPGVLDNIPSLKRLDLSANDILILDTFTFPASFIDFSQNRVTIISSAVISRFTPSLQLNLTGNPFDCSCDLIPFIQWIANNKISESTLVNLSEYKCVSPLNVHGKPMLDINPKALIRSCFPPPWKAIVIAVASSVAVIMMICGALIYRFRWSLRLWLYYINKHYKSRSSPGSFQQMGLDDDEDGYDLMVSSFPNDEGGMWVREVLIPAIDRRERTRHRVNVNSQDAMSLETEGFILFVQERDLAGSEVSIGPVIEAMRKARKVMLVVTDGYLKDGKCRFEMDYAVYKSLSADHGIDDVVAVLFDESIDVRLLSLLHRSLKLNKVLRWTPNDENGQHLFWQQLRDRLTQDQEH
jgi:Leucine-rich repeat (LRR) protein